MHEITKTSSRFEPPRGELTTSQRVARRAVPLFVAAGAACATAGPPSPADCRSDLPEDSIPLSTVIDSAATNEAIAALWRPATGLVIAQLRFDSVGAFDSARVITESLGPDVQADLKRVLGSAVERADATSPDRRTVRLFIGNEEGPALRGVRRFRTCAPRILDQPALTARIQAEAPGLNLAPGMTVTTRLRVFLRPNGAVGTVRVEESSGNVLADAAAGRVFQTARFTPAVIEGIAVPVWVRFPVNFRGRSRSSGR